MAPAWIGLALLLVGAPESKTGPTWVLGPGSERAVKRLSAEIESATGWKAGSIRIDGERVSMDFLSPTKERHQVALTRETIQLPEGLSENDAAAIRDRVSQTKLPWMAASSRGPPVTRPAIRVDVKRAQVVQEGRALSRAAREGREPIEAKPQGHPCAGCAEVREGEAPRLIRAHPEEPRVWVQGARDAWRRGRHHEALAALDVATRHDHVDVDAMRMWHRLQGGSVAPPSAGVESAFEEPVPALLRAAGILLGLAALVWLVAIGLRCGRLNLAIALVAVVLGAAAWSSAKLDSSELVAPPALPEALEAPLAGGPCVSAPALWSPQGREIYIRCERALSRLVIRPLGAEAQEGSLRHHTISVDGHGDHPEVRWSLDRLGEAVARAEAEGWRVTTRPRDSPGGVAPVPETVDDHEVRYATALIAGGVFVALLMTLWMGWWAWGMLASDPLLRRAALLGGALVVLGHIVLPDRMVMVYTGYDLAARLFSFGEIPRYGAGVVALYGAFGEVFGTDHRSILLANRIFGALTYVPLLVATMALVGARRVGLLVAMGLVLALPIVWRDHVSEAIISGSAWLLFTGLAGLLAGSLDEKLRPWAWLGLAPMAAGAVCRPEAPAAIGCVLLGVLAVSESRRWTVLLGGILIVALMPQLGWFDAVIAREVSSEGIIAPSAAISDRLSDVLARRNLFVYGPWLSSFTLVWIVAGCWRGERHRRLSVSLVAGAVAWIGASAVDLPVVSIPRIHLPALYLVLPVIAIGAERLVRWPTAQGFVIGLVALSAALSIDPVFGPANADHEETLIRVAKEHSPPPGGCVTLVDFDDPPTVGHTQRHFPRYLFPDRGMVGLDGFVDLWPTCGGQAIAILGTRCYMDYREPGEVLGPDAGLLPVCARFRDRFDLRPIEEMTIVNRTRWTFEMYPDTPTLDIGVYEVLGARERDESSKRGEP
ncbi:MAG: hypothetical protein CL940_02470 [Deltaproteobacteria bacterium]|nr:hypothetical protein [Deltaproteobacteria bacterium]